MAESTAEWLTTRQAMGELGIGRTRLWQLVREGRLTAYQRGVNRRARYYQRHEVERVKQEYQPVSGRKPGRRQEG